MEIKNLGIDQISKIKIAIIALKGAINTTKQFKFVLKTC